MAEWGAIAETDLELLHYADTPAEAFERLRAHLIAHHLEPATRAGSGRAGNREDARRVALRRTWTEDADHGSTHAQEAGRSNTRTATAWSRRRSPGATDDGARRASGAGKWTAREIVHHLADSEMTSAIRLRLLLARRRSDHCRLRPGQFARRLHYDRPIEPRSALQGRAADDGGDSGRMTDADWARRGYAQRAQRLVYGERWLESTLPHAHDHARRSGPRDGRPASQIVKSPANRREHWIDRSRDRAASAVSSDAGAAHRDRTKTPRGDRRRPRA